MSSSAPPHDDGGAEQRPMRILVVCTGNICRSPMAEAMIRQLARQEGLDAQVASVGMHAVSGPADPQAVRVMAARDIDLSGHRARQFRPVDASSADLVVAMERTHVVEIVAEAPAALRSTFTLPELVRLGHAVGPVGDASLSDWYSAVAALRDPAALLRAAPEDEVDDPYRRGRRAFNRCAVQLDELCAGAVRLLVA